MTFKPTPEQQAILDASLNSSTSLMVTAYAGCAKSTTLELIAHALPPAPALGLAFNVKIKKELEKRFPSNFQIKTFNGLGHAALAKALGKFPEVDEGKLGKLVTKYIKLTEAQDDGELWDNTRQIVTAAMNQGLVPSAFPWKGLVEDTPAAWAAIGEDILAVPYENYDLARAILVESIKLGLDPAKPVISFDDQIYLSTLFGGQYPRYGLVLVDEAQDLSPLNHLQIKRCASGRLIVVGDPKQAIYAFRGADSTSMGKLRALRKEWIDLPLATTFRCPQVIVERQQNHAPGFTAWATAKIGQFLPWNSKENPQPWTWARVEQELRAGQSCAFLCRNNAPLLSMAFKLLRQRISCHMLGRDIGKGLISLSKKVLKDGQMPKAECITLIQDWIDKEVQLAQANDKAAKVAGIKDRGECLLAVIEAEGVECADDLRKALRDLFDRSTGQITLSTGHRAKGMEWDLVVHLDPWRLPSKHARKAADRGDMSQLQQEMNLKYVIETRAKETLIQATVEDFR